MLENEINFTVQIRSLQKDNHIIWSKWWWLDFLSRKRPKNPGWGPDPNFRLIRLSGPKLSLITLSRRKLTLIRLSRPKLPLIRLSRHRGSLIRLFRRKAFWSDHLQTMFQTPIQTISQTLIRLWSDSSALEVFWSEKDFTYEQIW